MNNLQTQTLDNDSAKITKMLERQDKVKANIKALYGFDVAATVYNDSSTVEVAINRGKQRDEYTFNDAGEVKLVRQSQWQGGRLDGKYVATWIASD